MAIDPIPCFFSKSWQDDGAPTIEGANCWQAICGACTQLWLRSVCGLCRWCRNWCGFVSQMWQMLRKIRFGPKAFIVRYLADPHILAQTHTNQNKSLRNRHIAMRFGAHGSTPAAFSQADAGYCGSEKISRILRQISCSPKSCRHGAEHRDAYGRWECDVLEKRSFLLRVWERGFCQQQRHSQRKC